MAQFPRNDADLITLAQAVIRGFRNNPTVFPSPPVNPDSLEGKVGHYGEVDHQWNANQAQGVMLTAQRKEVSGDISDDVRLSVRYAEMVVTDDAQLALIGWAGHAARTALETPGQPHKLTDAKQGADWISLTWESPPDGGKPATYIIQYRIMPDGDWTIADTTPDTKITLAGQPKAKTLEYRVFARNKVGDGLPSNVIDVVL